MPGCSVSLTTESFCSVLNRRRRATPVMTSIFENVSDISVCLGACPRNALELADEEKRIFCTFWSARTGKFQKVMSGANQCPLASDFVEPPKQQLAEAFRVLDFFRYRFEHR